MTKRISQRLRAADANTGRGGKGQELTPKQAEFVRQFLHAGGDATQAAKAAGYSEVSAGTIGYQLLQKPHVAAAILSAQRSEFAELASIANEQARLMLLDPGVSASAKVSLITAVWDRAGLVTRKDEGEDGEDSNDMREWSIARLEAFLTERMRHRQQEARDATIIDAEADETPVSGELDALPAPAVNPTRETSQ